MDHMKTLNDTLNKIFFGTPTVILILAVSLYYTFSLKVIQRYLPTAFKNIFKSKGQKNGISGFKAVSTSLAATVGTGSITGAAAAVAIGGAGSVFWMWVCSFFSMATAYAEGVLSVVYRDRGAAHNKGGAMYYIQYGLKSKSLAKLFSFLCILSSFGMGNIAQTNAISQTLSGTFMPKRAVIILLFVLIAFIITKGREKTADFCELIIPFAALIYIIGCVIIILKFSYRLPSALEEIFKGAFGFDAAVGGVTGEVIRQSITHGVKRGVFSSEAGLGTTASIHAASDISSPCEAGLFGIFEVFADTPIICTLSALVLLCTGQTQSIVDAFSHGLGLSGNIIIIISITLFGIATIIGWSFIGKSCAEFLGGKTLSSVYIMLYPLLCILGAVMPTSEVFTLCDTVNGIIALPNLTALVLLSPVVIRHTREYFAKPCTDKVKKQARYNARCNTR